MHVLTTELSYRAIEHDCSKLCHPEVSGFTEYEEGLDTITYGSPEYFAQKEKLKEVLDKHYAANRHHPEHFENGVDDMNLVDIVEMLVDWCSSTYRSKDGNIRSSLIIQQSRFNIEPQLMKIIENTVNLLDEKSNKVKVINTSSWPEILGPKVVSKLLAAETRLGQTLYQLLVKWTDQKVTVTDICLKLDVGPDTVNKLISTFDLVEKVEHNRIAANKGNPLRYGNPRGENEPII